MSEIMCDNCGEEIVKCSDGGYRHLSFSEEGPFVMSDSAVGCEAMPKNSKKKSKTKYEPMKKCCKDTIQDLCDTLLSELVEEWRSTEKNDSYCKGVQFAIDKIKTALSKEAKP